MGYYRPRPSEVKNCKHCAIPFETNHKRAIYCGDSCRQLAYKLRHGHETEKAGSAKGDLNLSLQNVGIVAGSAGLAAIANYYTNDQPAQQQLLDKFAQLDKDLKTGLNNLNRGTQHLVDGINALRASNPLIAQEFDRIQEDRLLEQAKIEGKQDLVQRILAKRQAKAQGILTAGR